MDQELQTAITEFVTPYIEDRHRILNIAAAVEELSVACPGVDRERIAEFSAKVRSPSRSDDAPEAGATDAIVVPQVTEAMLVLAAIPISRHTPAAGDSGLGNGNAYQSDDSSTDCDRHVGRTWSDLSSKAYRRTGGRHHSRGAGVPYWLVSNRGNCTRHCQSAALAAEAPCQQRVAAKVAPAR